MTDSLKSPASPAVVPPDAADIQKTVKIDVARMLLKILASSKNAGATLKEMKQHFGTLLNNILQERNLAHGESSPMVKPGSFFISGTLLFWLGAIVGQVWIPTIGLAIGALGAAGISAGFKMIYDQERDFEYLKLFYSCLVLMQKADKVITDQERKNLEGFVLSLGIPEAKKKELVGIANENLESLVIPDWLTDDQKRNILLATWSSAVCDGVVLQENIFFSQLADKMGISLTDMERLKNDALRQVEALEQTYLNMSAFLAKLVPETKDQSRSVIEVLNFLFPREMNRSRSLEMIRGIVRGEDTPVQLIGKWENSAHVLIGAYILYKACVETPAARMGGEGEPWLSCWDVLKDPDAGEEVKDILDDMFDLVEKRVGSLTTKVS